MLLARLLVSTENHTVTIICELIIYSLQVRHCATNVHTVCDVRAPTCLIVRHWIMKNWTVSTQSLETLCVGLYA